MRLTDRLIIAGMFVFTLFVNVMNKFLPVVFDRVLRLEAYALPRRALLQFQRDHRPSAEGVGEVLL